MSAKTDKFIQTIGTLARNEYLSRDKWILPSVCIAQAALESGWNLNAKSVFGVKGAGFKSTTTEYYNGVKTTIVDSFRTYPNISAAVVGYYDFLAKTPRYKNALNNPNYQDAVYRLIHTTDGAPYATDPFYISKICNMIKSYNLTSWDSRLPQEVSIPVVKPENGSLMSVEQMAKEVIKGKWGNGEERKRRITEYGLDYKEVQNLVNKMLLGR